MPMKPKKQLASIPFDDDKSHYDTTDPGNALRFVGRCGDKFRYVDELGWFVWDGKRFRHDPSGVRLRKMAMKHAIAEYASIKESNKDVKNLWDDPEVKKFRGNKMIHRIRGMVEAVKSVDGVQVDAGAFDRDQNKINLLNGVLDLDDYKVYPHNPSFMMTKLANVSYDDKQPDLPCPAFEDFLAKAVPGGPEVVSYLQRYSGYAISGETIERCFLVLHGIGANGKSTFIGVLFDILGDYALDCPIEVFLKEKHELHRTYLVRLRGARLVISSETEEGKVIRAARVKQMTGEDPVTANLMARDPITFHPVMKLILAVNYLPEIRDLGEGMWDRIRSIQNWPRIDKDKRNRRIKADLLAERNAIFAWMVRGHRAWREGTKNGRSGLAEPQWVLADVESYRKKMDVMSGFLDEMLVRDAKGRVERDQMLSSYIAWCEVDGRTPASKIEFNKWLRKQGFVIRRQVDDKYYWFGVALATPVTPPDSGAKNE